MATAKAADWESMVHEVRLEWISPMDYPQFLEWKFSAERAAFLESVECGIYLWRVKRLLGLVRQNLYVGQTWQGFGPRTRQHLKGDLGVKLKRLGEEGRDPYLFCASVEAQNMPQGRGLIARMEAVMNSVERALIWVLRPEWNAAHSTTTNLPLHVKIQSVGEVPSDMSRVIEVTAGKHHRSA